LQIGAICNLIFSICNFNDFVFISLWLSQKRLQRANLLIQLRLDPPVGDQPHQRYEYVKSVGDPLMNKADGIAKMLQQQ